MALIYRAQLAPTKLDLLRAWLPAQPWWSWRDAAVDILGAYRFDDPGGEVGIETHLLQVAGGPIVQVPVTYRGAAVEQTKQALIGTTEHSVLGRRWVYDGCFDPVYLTALVTAILTGESEAELRVVAHDGFERREPTARVHGSGAPGTPVPSVGIPDPISDGASAMVRVGDRELVVRRVVDGDLDAGDAETLTGTWAGTDVPTAFAMLR